MVIIMVVQENLYVQDAGVFFLFFVLGFFLILVCIQLCRETDVTRFDGEALQFIQQLLAKNFNASYKF